MSGINHETSHYPNFFIVHWYMIYSYIFPAKVGRIMTSKALIPMRSATVLDRDFHFVSMETNGKPTTIQTNKQTTPCLA
jgi:hypothetical protein